MRIRWRLLAAVGLAGVPRLLAAQSPEVAGLARAATDKHALSCIRAVLEDSAGHDIASTRTDARGLFDLVAPAAGAYRVRFDLPTAKPVVGPVDTLAAGAYSEQVYELPFLLRDSTDGPVPIEDQFRARATGVFPHYPPNLRDAGIEGDAVAEFVLDPTGAIDERSIRIVQQTHADFGAAVTDALRRMVFDSPHDNGAAVCQRVIQRFEFRVRR